MTEQLVKNKLAKYLDMTDQDYIDRDELEEIFDDSELEISDEMGWRAITALSVYEGDFLATFCDQEGDEETDVIYLSNNELDKLNNWLDNN